MLFPFHDGILHHSFLEMATQLICWVIAWTDEIENITIDYTLCEKQARQCPQVQVPRARLSGCQQTRQ